jgi:hypothetical protein
VNSEIAIWAVRLTFAEAAMYGDYRGDIATLENEGRRARTLLIGPGFAKECDATKSASNGCRKASAFTDSELLAMACLLQDECLLFSSKSGWKRVGVKSTQARRNSDSRYQFVKVKKRLREGELRGVQWPDYAGTELTVNRSIWRTVVNQPKTRASRDAVPVIPALARILDEYRRSMGNPRDGAIFHSGDGEPMDMDNQGFDPAVTKAMQNTQATLDTLKPWPVTG